ncbi:MAG: prepilin-type N-terminal cleavage/methylation domain-containing protein [Pelagibacteraceae bacterium]|nr:prepilin-type N-terminal cleavage/methylation domain-containing protein [Pelagibacteraceae bacterium]
MRKLCHEKTFRDRGSVFVMKQKGFTLIELLVVVALNQTMFLNYHTSYILEYPF